MTELNPTDPSLSLPPLPYASIASQRPQVITGMAITSVVLGSIGLLLGLFGFASNAMTFGNNGRNVLAPALPPVPRMVMIASLIDATCVFCFCGVMVIGGIAALKLKPFARKLMVNWSIAALVFVIVNTTVTLIWLGPARIAWITQAQPGNPLVTSGLMSVLMVGGVVFNCLIESAMPVLFLILWRRPKVRAAFGESAAI